MSEKQKKQLERQLWNIANTLRGKMNADEFRDYILGFIFYKYLSEKMDIYANNILKPDGIKFTSINESKKEGQEYIEAIREEALEKLGYFLKPSELFSEVAKRGNYNSEGEPLVKEDETTYGSASNFILEDLQKILNNVQNSTMGTDSEEDFDNLFEDMDLNSTKLGKTPEARNEVIAKVLAHLDKIDFKLENTELDVLGDAYEYLIGKFASGAGKKAGEFYTPQEVSIVLAKLVTTGKKKLKSVYDPTCGSGSLLLRVAKEVDEVNNFFGQELNRTTYNLARMNMILHDVHYRKFDIKQEDTLENPQHLEHRFDAIVANPPFSARWSANKLFMSDDRFSQYGKLAPSSKADFAFVQHMIYQLSENGSMAIVLPHGVLFRGGSEAQIRKYLIEEKNYIDAIIGLPENIFFGTGIPTCILVLKKCRENPDDVLIMDTSNHYKKSVNQNLLRTEDMEKLINTYRQRITITKYSYVTPIQEIKENKYKLNISRYLDVFEEPEEIDISLINNDLSTIQSLNKSNDIKLNKLFKELNVTSPTGSNLVLLKQFRKGIMQRLFSRKLRFKNNSKAFKKWDSTNFGELTNKFTEKNKKLINATIYSVTNYDGFVVQSDHFDKEVASADLSSYKIVRKNDFAYNPARINVGSIAHFKKDVGIISSLYVCFRTNEKILDDYLLYLLELDYTKYQISTLGEGGVRIYLWYDLFSLIKCQLPEIDEQKRIIDFLSKLDYKISLIEKVQN